MTEQRVSSRYARALLQTAAEEKLADEVFQDLNKMRTIIESSRDLKSFIKSPIVQFWKKKKAFEEIFKPVLMELTYKFLLLLADKRRETIIDSVIEQYEKQYNELNNRLPVKIFSAVELDNELKDRISKKMEEITGKTVLSDFRKDEKLKGGILVRIDDWVFDGSVKNQLEILYKKLARGEDIV